MPFEVMPLLQAITLGPTFFCFSLTVQVSHLDQLFCCVRLMQNNVHECASKFRAKHMLYGQSGVQE